MRNEWSNYTNWAYNWTPYNIVIPPIEDGYKYDGYNKTVGNVSCHLHNPQMYSVSYSASNKH